jgi:hypothetical protein
MDPSVSSALEKRLIYLRGVAAGIQQGANPNVSRFKYQIDYEIAMLEKQMQQVQQVQQAPVLAPTPSTQPSPKSMVSKSPYPTLNIGNRASNATMIQEPVENSLPSAPLAPVQSHQPQLPTDRDYQQLEEIARKITYLKEMLLQNNNLMKTMGKARTYQSNIKLQGISKKNAELMSSIHNTQIIYEMMKHKIQQSQEAVLKAAADARRQQDGAKPPKSILKKNIQIRYEKETTENHPTQRRIQINTERNTVAEIPSSTSYGQSAPASPISAPSPLRRLVRREPEPVERVNAVPASLVNDKETDKEMLEEFQNTIGSLQRLLL